MYYRYYISIFYYNFEIELIQLKIYNNAALLNRL